MTNSKKGNRSSISRFHLSLKDYPKIAKERENMREVTYALTIGILMYAMLCTFPDICFTVGLVSRYQANLGPRHWQEVKHILNYL